VRNRVPYYGEYMVKNEDGEWAVNEKYIGTEPPLQPAAADD
jgi:cyclic pyranopterin phosphate synthase